MRHKNNKPNPNMVRDNKFIMLPNEKKVFDAILEETLHKYRRCASLSISNIAKMTGIANTTVADQLRRLERRELITIEKRAYPHVICINIPYKEIY